MDSTNADSDHSMTWEDFFGSTSELAPTLLGIYDSLLEPKSKPPDDIKKIQIAKDDRNEPPLPDKKKNNIEVTKVNGIIQKESINNTQKTYINVTNKITMKSHLTLNKSSLYTMKTKINDEVMKTSDIVKKETNAFDNLSPNVKRMISTVSETSTLKFQKQPITGVRASIRGHKSNIPLVGATSKISQSGVEILPSVEIYDQPSTKIAKLEDKEQILKPNFKLGEQPYDVPTSNKPISKEAYESLSLPYIDQSLDLNIDREFDTKLSPKIEPEKPEKMTSASTGNLKEVHRLNPPSVEVSRPLSMSSIASSSSTSSSGVQNKGVNSAYLASIESLDDSDDVVSNGSNNFVNSTGVKSVSVDRSDGLPCDHYEEMSGLSQLERVCAEIVHTENVYVRDLQQVVEGYLHEWKREMTFSADELKELFNNIEDIYNFNRSLCEELNTCRLDATCIARCFVNNTSGFSIYTSYCTGYPCTMARLAALASNPHSAREFRERQLALSHPLPLASYLLKPVQRILKYHLLLQNVVKQQSSSDTEYALLKMTGIAQHIDEMKRRHEHAVRVQEIQSLLYGWTGPDLTTYGELCAEGTFRVFGAKAMRHVFLFDKMLLVTKNREDGILAYKSHIMCNNMMLVEAIAGAPLSFHVIPWDSPRNQLTLQASSQRHKREWTLLLKRVILENYNAVIPSHARQLVMELGQNKTDDDMLAEKSHNLITQASMRKQLSAPEYLEKRKLERERRKSFETNRNRIKKENRKYKPKTLIETKSCDCVSVSIDKGIDFTCENCYVDVCSDCEIQVLKDKCECPQKCAECDRSLHYIDAGSTENIERKNCKCSDIKSSQESLGVVNSLSQTRGYHSSDNIVSYDKNLGDSLLGRNCMNCKSRDERRSRNKNDKADTLRSKSNDAQRSKLSKIGTWRRKSEPGLQNAPNFNKKQTNKNITDAKGAEKMEFMCRFCGSNKISRKNRSNISDHSQDNMAKSNLEVQSYNSKIVPKKISKIKKNRNKGRMDTSAKFYADLSTDISTEVLHITESNESLHEKPVKTEILSKDDDIDEETYKKLIEKTDSFKKNELEKVKYLNKEKVINESVEEDDTTVDRRQKDTESCEENEQPLEQIISQLLMHNREFQNLLKKQHQRNITNRRNQRLLKSYSNPEQAEPTIEVPTKTKFERQISDNTDAQSKRNEVIILSPPNEEDYSDDDHIYETLRVEKREESNKNNQSKIARPKKIIEPKKISTHDDYVYLTFNGTNKDEGIYDVPVKSPEKVKEKKEQDYYVLVENKTPVKGKAAHYDSVEVTKRKKEPYIAGSNEYLPMSPEKRSPNTPEIWLSRQKEHFNISCDRKSGSLPRSFQVGTPEDDKVSTFKLSNNKTYLNREGKVLSVDRPFTIASDQSELSFDEVEQYIDDRDLKLNSTNDESTQDVSKSTLELEEEIDRCYKNNFEKKIKTAKTESLLETSQSNLNNSITSSCEVLTDKTVEMGIVHPEHKIYKPTGNILSLKNVLGRFRNRSLSKSQDDSIEQGVSSLEGGKSDLKSPTNEKRTGLNPRSYSRNLLQRFRSIIGDEHDELKDINKKRSSLDNSQTKNEIKVVITDASQQNSNEPLSKSDNTIIVTNSPSEKNTLDTLSHSCDSIKKTDTLKNVASTILKNNVPNKLPIYMQGSKCLGARIAQSDYADPTSLVTEKSKVNVLINKTAVRPDSLFSNSSFVTSSSESTYAEINKGDTTDSCKIIGKTDENCYEKSFEKIEQITDDVFRDSAVYSDQEDVTTKTEPKKVITKFNSIEKRTNKNETNNPIRSRLQKTEINKLVINDNKSKIAPPVPIKPKITNIPTKTSIQAKTDTKHKIIKPQVIRSESTPPEDKPKIEEKPIIKNSIQLTRLTFERASLDSATRKQRIENRAEKSKTVLERRLEIESLTKTQIKSNIKKPSQITKTKTLTTKVVPFEKITESKTPFEKRAESTLSKTENKKIDIPNIHEADIEDSKGSWVKTVVNKFQ